MGQPQTTTGASGMAPPGAQAPEGSSGDGGGMAAPGAGALAAGVDAIGTKLTGQLLKWSWQYLIPSFGLTLFYINLHFIARYLASSRMFSNFGQLLATGKSKSASSGGPAGDIGKAAEYAEIMAMLVINLIVVAIIVLILVIISIMAYAITDPMGFVSAVGLGAGCTLASALGVGGKVTDVCKAL
ncbi:MAG: hypothetical protein Q7T01_01675 [bacterium]|nr:hypothetical protein [bacterium]